MLVTKQSAITGIIRTLDLPITEEQLHRFSQGELAQSVFPDLTSSEREFLINGTLEEEWDAMAPN